MLTSSFKMKAIFLAVAARTPIGRFGGSLKDWTAADLAAFSPHFTADFARLLSPREGMKSREIPGGTGPESVAGALQRARERLASMRL